MIRALCLATLLAWCVGAANAEILARSAVDLRLAPSAASDQITLGDIFENAGAAASIPVIAAPRPGQKIMIDARSLAALATRHSLDWTNPGGVTNVEVTRAGREVSAEAIGDAISKELALQAGGRDLAIRLLQSDLTLTAAAEDLGDPRVKIVAFDDPTGRFQAQVDVPGGNRALIAGVADEVMSVPVLARPLQRGEVVAEADIAWTRLRIDTIGRQTLTDAGAMIGLSARRPLRSGQPLITGDVERPAVIMKGARVTMTFKTPGMTLTDSGRALENGAIGDLINVVNERSHRTVQARVVSANAVELSPALAPIPGPQANLSP